MKIIKQSGEAGIPLRLKRVSDRIGHDILRRYRETGFDAEPSWLPILLTLKENKLSSVQEIASSLGISHSAAVQFIQKMEDRNLVEVSSDSLDKRKKLLALSKHGFESLEIISPVQSEIETAFLKLNEEIGLDLINVLEKIETAFSRISFYDRIKESFKEQAIKDVEILSYSKRLNKYFKDLNYEWLQKYFEVETIDELILNDPYAKIIKKGGEIFFARINGEIIGTCAAIKIDRDTFELAKMAVTEKARGRQAGKKLALAVIGFAWSKKAKYVTLLTNSRLVEAVNLYKSLGFETIPEPEDHEYKRKVFKMRLEL